jgi:hypothetical protein
MHGGDQPATLSVADFLVISFVWVTDGGLSFNITDVVAAIQPFPRRGGGSK